MEIEIINIIDHSKNYKISVTPETRIKDLKTKFEHDMGIPVEKQILFYCNKTDIDLPYGYSQKLKDKNTLSDYNISNNSTIIVHKIMVYNFIFTMENEKGEKYEISLLPSSRILDLVYLISEHDHVNQNRISLFFNGKEIKDGNTPLAFARIPNESTIQYKIMEVYEGGTMQIVVKNRIGKNVVLMVDPTETVLQLKQQIKDKEGIPLEFIHLSYYDERTHILLEDDKMLQDYSIGNRAKVHMVSKSGLRGGPR